MRVKSTQLVPGCVLLRDVPGKTKHPIIRKKTHLTKQHLLFLEKFLVKTVDVESRLANGERFQPDEALGEIEETEFTDQMNHHVQSIESWESIYDKTVQVYGKMFKAWQQGVKIDMPQLRQHVIPLFEHISEIGSNIWLLAQRENKQTYIAHHAIATGILSYYLAKKLGFSSGEQLQIGLAGVLADTGMANIDPELLKKEAALTDEEYKKIMQHPVYSFHRVKGLTTVSKKVQMGVLQHHERLDGSGYPLGLGKVDIHKYAKIIAVADTYHALTSERIYRERLTPFNAVNVIKKEMYARFDSSVVQKLIAGLHQSLIGQTVILSDQTVGEVVFIDEHHFDRPMVKINLTDKVIALKDRPDLMIMDITLNS